MGRKVPRGSFWAELVSRRDEFHVELVSPRDEAVFLNSFPTVFFYEFLCENGLSCVFPPLLIEGHTPPLTKRTKQKIEEVGKN